MKSLKVLIFVSTLVQVGSWNAVEAQQVPSAVAILPAPAAQKTEAVEPPSEELETTRYEKRAVTPRRQMPIQERRPSIPQTVEPDPMISKPLDQATSLQYATPTQSPEPKEDEQPSVGDEVRDLVIGGSTDQVTKYESFLNPDDIRRNRVELELAPIYVYNESKSEHWVRSYNTSTPGGRLALNVWFTPFFGIHSSYTKTFQGSTQKQFGSASQTPVMDQWLEIGLRFRRFTSRSVTSPGMTIGLDYYDYQRKLPVDDLYRNGLQTTGLLASVESRLPTSENFAWILRVDYMPIVTHREIMLASEKKSGLKAETFNAGIAIGPEFKLNRSNRLFVRGRVLYERNSFSGQTNTADPQTGQTPENLSVTNSFFFFEMGYIWGN